jgi:hypothetical protein
MKKAQKAWAFSGVKEKNGNNLVRPNAIESDTPAIDERRGGGIGDPSIPRRWICNVMKSSRAEGGGKPKKKGGPKSIDSAPFRSYGFYRHVKKKTSKKWKKGRRKKNLIEFYGCVPPHTHSPSSSTLGLYIYTPRPGYSV